MSALSLADRVPRSGTERVRHAPNVGIVGVVPDQLLADEGIEREALWTQIDERWSGPSE